MQPDPFRLRLSALMGFLAIALGASGAHGGVHDKLVAAGELAHWETAVQYHLPHAVVLLLLTLFASTRPQMVWAWRLFLAGILLFSGSLYVLAYTGTAWLGRHTPRWFELHGRLGARGDVCEGKIGGLLNLRCIRKTRCARIEACSNSGPSSQRLGSSVGRAGD
jgi:uncharacterized membrane protein YgdD (TMEM256/DUF423 family)